MIKRLKTKAAIPDAAGQIDQHPAASALLPPGRMSSSAARALGINAKQTSRNVHEKGGVVVLNLIDAFIMAASLAENRCQLRKFKTIMGIAVEDRRYSFWQRRERRGYRRILSAITSRSIRKLS